MGWALPRGSAGPEWRRRPDLCLGPREHHGPKCGRPEVSGGARGREVTGEWSGSSSFQGIFYECRMHCSDVRAPAMGSQEGQASASPEWGQAAETEAGRVFRRDTPACSHAQGAPKFWANGAEEVTPAADNCTTIRASG